MTREELQDVCDAQLRIDQLESRIASMKVYIAALEMAVEVYKSALDVSRGVNKIYDKKRTTY